MAWFPDPLCCSRAIPGRQVNSAAGGRLPLGEGQPPRAVRLGRRIRRTDTDACRAHEVQPDEVYLAAESDVQTVLGHIEAVKPTLVVVDSVQTMTTTEADGVVGGVTQVRRDSRPHGSGEGGRRRDGPRRARHQDGAIAGPRSLEHLVDVVLHFEGDRNTALRMVRGIKNRFGAADEVGCFSLHGNGIESIADPSRLFRDQRPKPVPGTAITVTLEGKRPLIGEIQALLALPSNPGATPRRAVSRIDNARTAMITAVLEKHAKLKVGENDIYLSTVGGMRLTDPSADLAVAVAMASAYTGLAPSTDDRRDRRGRPHRRSAQRPGMDRRLAEALRLGFTSAIVPARCGKAPFGLKTLESRDDRGRVADSTRHRRIIDGQSARRVEEKIEQEPRGTGSSGQ